MWAHSRNSLAAQMVKNLPAMRETWVRSLGWEGPLEEGMATHSSILTWRIPMDKRAWQATVLGVSESDSTEQLSMTHYFQRDSGHFWKKCCITLHDNYFAEENISLKCMCYNIASHSAFSYNIWKSKSLSLTCYLVDVCVFIGSYHYPRFQFT